MQIQGRPKKRNHGGRKVLWRGVPLMEDTRTRGKKNRFGASNPPEGEKGKD